MNDTFREILTTICSRPEWEMEWVDLLSQLEYVGCRKIVKAVPFEKVNLSVLRHVAEEASHAYLLKAAVKDRSWTEGKLSAIGWHYFQRLDHGISALSVQPDLRYPAVSWAIERRVIEIYPLYIEITRNDSVVRALRQILAQEKRHKDQFDAVEFPDEYRVSVTALEASLWDDFQRALEATFSLPRP